MTLEARPTWQLVLEAARQLTSTAGELRLQELVAQVQRLDPARGRASVQPVVQGMTVEREFLRRIVPRISAERTHPRSSQLGAGTDP